ncbi:MAG: hypothetical protein M0R49_07065 [Limnochordia bacterium]|nr:hypothetical protein [Limnochordia bacterium]
MSIKFPDFQVLVSRSDQVPRMNREGDPTGAAGKMAPQVTEEFAAREQRVQKNKQKDEIRDRQENEGRRPGQQEQEEQEEQRQPRNRRHIDLRA